MSLSDQEDVSWPTRKKAARFKMRSLRLQTDLF